MATNTAIVVTLPLILPDGGGSWGQSYSVDLRVVAFVEAGHSRRAAARHFAFGDGFAVKLMQRLAASGSCEPARHGRPPGKGKLALYAAFLLGIVKAEPDITMPELCAPVGRDARRVG